MAESQFADLEPTTDSAGRLLRAAREAAGWSVADVSARTKIREHHVVAMEAGDFDALGGKSYATGFTRTYAKAVGLDAEEIVQKVRDELGYGQNEDRRATQTLEPGDPSRIPQQGVVWIGFIGAVVVVVGAFIFYRSFWSPAAELPSLLPADRPAAHTAAPKAKKPAPAAAAAPQGPVVFTATEDQVWVKFTDAAGGQLLQKNLALNESYTAPEGARLRTGRPDALKITVGGREVPRLGTGPGLVKDVPVSAAALMARPPGVAVTPSPLPTSLPTSLPTPVLSGTPTP